MRTTYPNWYRKARSFCPTPPSSFKRKWRQEERTVEKRLVRTCRDYDALSFARPHRESSIYDWY